MEFPTELLEARLLRRYKRFLADVRLASGEVVIAHCANPGSMKSCIEEGGKIWVTRARASGRKLLYTWQIAEVASELIFVNPQLSNDIVRAALRRGAIPELSGYDILRREVPVFGRSRLDFALYGAGQCFVEVKNVTLDLGDNRSAFPDSVTARGARHLDELIALVKAGHRAVILFTAARSATRSVEPARHIDPTYSHKLEQAVAAGVEALAYRCAISVSETTASVRLSERLPVLF